MVIVNSFEELKAHEGEVIGTTDWFKITQERINMFAEATDDRQWIHTDPERAKTESPYGQTIAHGYLTLSVLPQMWMKLIQVNNVKMMVNYGLDKLRFAQPVLSGDDVQLTATLQSVVNLRGITKTEISFVLHIKGQKRQALEGVATFLYYFDGELKGSSKGVQGESKG